MAPGQSYEQTRTQESSRHGSLAGWAAGQARKWLRARLLVTLQCRRWALASPITLAQDAPDVGFVVSQRTRSAVHGPVAYPSGSGPRLSPLLDPLRLGGAELGLAPGAADCFSNPCTGSGRLQVDCSVSEYQEACAEFDRPNQGDRYGYGDQAGDLASA